MHVIATVPLQKLLQDKKTGRPFWQSQDNFETQQRMREMLGHLAKSPTGVRLLEHSAARKYGVALAADTPVQLYGESDHRRRRVILDAGGSIPVMATVLAHELTHVIQPHTEFLVNPHKSRSIGDTAYPMIVREGDAFSTQVLVAHELAEAGEPAALDYLKFETMYAGMTELLPETGAPYDTDKVHGDLFDGWMTKSLTREGYDAKFMQDIGSRVDHYGHLGASVSHGKTFLASLIVGDYPGDRDLTARGYLGIWGSLHDSQDLMKRLQGPEIATVYARTSMNRLEQFIRNVRHVTETDKAGSAPLPDVARAVGSPQQADASLLQLTMQAILTYSAMSERPGSQIEQVCLCQLKEKMSKATEAKFGQAWDQRVSMLSQNLNRATTLPAAYRPLHAEAERLGLVAPE